MLINDYQFGRTEPMNELERYSKLEGIDYQYLMTCMKAKPGGICRDSANDRKPVRKLIRFFFQFNQDNGIF